MLADSFHFYKLQLLTEQPSPYFMSHFKIKRSLLPRARTKHRYMYHEGQLDYLGQFLVQMGYRIEPKTRFPSELKKVIPPFTQHCRGSIIDSITTLRILHLDLISPQEHEDELRLILPNWTIEFVT